MNTHPLTDDMRMYYNGTYIFREHKGRVETMRVEDTERTGDDTLLDGFDFIGYVFGEGLERQGRSGRWSGDQMIQYRPLSGYYQLGEDPAEKSYVSFTINNRTQRKGVDLRNVLVDGEPCGEFSGLHLAKMFYQSQAMCSQPASRDLYVTTNGQVHWKGNWVGEISTETGEFSVDEAYSKMEGLLCRLLQNT